MPLIEIQQASPVTPEVSAAIIREVTAAYAQASGSDPSKVWVLIHEVPAVGGDDPRIVLAVFIGYEPADPEVFVWS